VATEAAADRAASAAERAAAAAERAAGRTGIAAMAFARRFTWRR